MSIYRNHLPIMGASGAQSTGYEIEQSIRFNDDDSPFMDRTPSSASNQTTWTISCWVKIGNIPGNYTIWCVHTAYQSYAQIRSSTGLEFAVGNGSSGSSYHALTSFFRDPSAWYHLVMIFDSTNNTSSERARIYVNGQRETDFSNTGSWTKNYSSNVNSTQKMYIGEQGVGGNHMEGYIAEFHHVDGYAYGPEYFGEFNSSNIWIPKEYSESYGTNGFYLKGQNSSALGDDSSGNNNDFTVQAGLAASDQVLDSPTNNFCVANPLDNYFFAGTFSDGNLKLTSSSASGNYTFHTTTMKLPETGKWYAEVECDVVGSGVGFGISENVSTAINKYIGNLSTAFAYYSNGQSFHEGGSSFGDSYTSGDIIGIAVDMDNKKIYYSKNGVFQGSGNPAGNSNGLSIDSGVTYFFAANDDTGAGTTSTWIWNFGQGGTNTGGMTDSNGIGNFKYSVPSGFLALCSKNLGS